MQVNPINNDRSFKACYKAPFSNEGYNKLFKVLKNDGGAGICIYSKPQSSTKNIAFFPYSFPYSHLYQEELTSALIDNKRITKEEAEKSGLKWNIFRKLNIFNFAILPPAILNSRLEEIRKKGIDVDSLFKEESIYVTTEEDTKVVEEFMVPKIKAHIKKHFGNRRELGPLELLDALCGFNPGPEMPKQNFIQRLINKHRTGKKAVAIQLKYQELQASLNNKNLSVEDAKRIIQEINTLKAQLAEQSEPRYIKNARILTEQFKQEKERFDNLFFKNREVISVDSVDELLKEL